MRPDFPPPGPAIKKGVQKRGQVHLSAGPFDRPSRLACTFPHFMGYRYVLFFLFDQDRRCRVDFDYYRIGQSGGSR